MIIHKSGCELLESFLEEFASFLQSYGVRVKMTSSNDHVIDEEGGIASYLQNNISQCDMVFVVVTEDSGGKYNYFKGRNFRVFWSFKGKF